MKVFSPFLNGTTTTSGSFNVPNHPSTDSIPNPLTGSLFHDDTDGILKIYTGTQWQVVGEQAVPVYNPNATFSDLSLTGSQSTGTNVASISITDEDNQTPYSASLSGPDASNFTFEWSNADSSSGFIETATSLSAGTYSYFVTVFDSDLNSSIYARTTIFATPPPYSADFLVLGGGAGGGKDRGGGGGAGGLRTSYGAVSGRGSSAESSIILQPGQIYNLTVGGGGSPASYTSTPTNGVNSSIAGAGITTITALGGGGGSGGNYSGETGADGGCGGGGGTADIGGAGTGGQGYNGGNADSTNCGGGGGTGSAGANAVGSTTGNGGNGTTVSITGASVTYGGGGGGGASTGTTGQGGSGGGGNGCTNNSSCTAQSGTANLGGGGGGNGGGGGGSGGSGGSGVVILRVPTSSYSGTTTGSPTVTTDSTYTVIKFTQSGTYTA